MAHWTYERKKDSKLPNNPATHLTDEQRNKLCEEMEYGVPVWVCAAKYQIHNVTCYQVYRKWRGYSFSNRPQLENKEE